MVIHRPPNCYGGAISPLMYLARSPRRARTREHLTGLLWPEKEERAARHSLNEALRLLRRVLAAPPSTRPVGRSVSRRGTRG